MKTHIYLLLIACCFSADVLCQSGFEGISLRYDITLQNPDQLVLDEINFSQTANFFSEKKMQILGNGYFNLVKNNPMVEFQNFSEQSVMGVIQTNKKPNNGFIEFYPEEEGLFFSKTNDTITFTPGRYMTRDLFYKIDTNYVDWGYDGMDFDGWSYDEFGNPIQISDTASQRLAEKIKGLAFFETWGFSSETGVFEKKIQGINAFDFKLVDYEERVLKEMISDSYFLFKMPDYNKPIIQSKTEGNKAISDNNMLVEEIVYDVLLPHFMLGDGIGNFPNYTISPENLSLLVQSLFLTVENKACSAFKITENQADFDKPIKFKDLLQHFSIQNNRTVYDKKLLDESRIQKIIYEEMEVYQIDDYGNEIFDEWGEYVISHYDKIEIDTLYQLRPIYREIVEIDSTYEDCIILDDNDDEMYDDYGNPIIETRQKSDTTWQIKPEFLHKISVNLSEKVYFNYVSDIHGIRFYESWYFDQETFSLHKQVNGIAIIFSKKLDYPKITPEEFHWTYDEENNNPVEEIILTPIYFKLNTKN